MGIEALLGKTLTNIERWGDVWLVFVTTDNERYKMAHSQECCETVYLDDINGDLDTLIGSPILVAESASNQDAKSRDNESDCQWTFYKLATVKGYVDLRWYGESNGYYSVGVDVIKQP